MRFTWDPEKDRKNQHVHRVSFETAKQVFSDPNHRVTEDCVVDGEQRWHAIRPVGDFSLLLVVHSVLDEDEPRVRLISARKVTPNERTYYEEDGGPY